MLCINHPAVEAKARCTGCAEPFCPNCLVTINGNTYCGKCKVLAVTKQPVNERNQHPCPEAGESLKYAIIGFFCFGFICGPMAISKALTAKKLIAKDPNLTGSGKATAGLIIGIIVTVLWAIGLIIKFSNIGKH